MNSVPSQAGPSRHGIRLRPTGSGEDSGSGAGEGGRPAGGGEDSGPRDAEADGGAENDRAPASQTISATTAGMDHNPSTAWTDQPSAIRSGSVRPEASRA